ncbi:histamine H2 receptor-like [Oculina patagonica]
MNFNSWNIVWSLCFGLLATLTVVGNFLTITIFLKRRLRKRAHFLLINLAVVDLLVGLLTVPLYMAISTLLYLGRPDQLVWSVYEYTDILTGITSIYTLAVISLERMYAIGWPLRHRTLNLRVYTLAIVTPWILAAVLTSLQLMVFFNVITRESLLFPVILFQSTPLLIMCTAYLLIWKKQKSPMGNQNHVAREARLAKTLFLITGASLLTWIPFQIMNLLLPLNVIGYIPNFNAIIYIIKFLQFSNSLVNVIIYPFRISGFKNALLQMFPCCVLPCRRGNEVDLIHQMRLDRLHHLTRSTDPHQT